MKAKLILKKNAYTNAFSVDIVGSIPNFNGIKQMKKTLHTFLNIAFIIAVFIDVLAVFIFEQNSNLLFAQIFLIGSLVVTLILCVPMIFRNS